jgi:hypothetical protein
MRDRVGKLVDLALHRGVVDWIDRLMQVFVDEQPDHRMRRHEIDLEFGAGRDLAFVLESLEGMV